MKLGRRARSLSIVQARAGACSLHRWFQTQLNAPNRADVSPAPNPDARESRHVSIIVGASVIFYIYNSTLGCTITEHRHPFIPSLLWWGERSFDLLPSCCRPGTTARTCVSSEIGLRIDERRWDRAGIYVSSLCSWVGSFAKARQTKRERTREIKADDRVRATTRLDA